MTAADSDWRDRAACRDVDTDLFFSTDREDRAQCRRICAACPVAEPCLQDALDTGDSEEAGIRAGTTPRQRKQLGRRRKTQAVALCGTPSGYDRHRRNGETACRPCKDANAEAERRRSQRRRSA